MSRPNLLPAFAPILALLAACSDPPPAAGPDPSKLPTLSVTAIGQGDGTTHVVACSSRPGNPFCAFEGDIVASSAGQEVELAYGMDDGERRHHGDLDGAEEDKEIIVSYRNEEAGVDAPSSRVLLPAALTITSPLEEAPVDASQDVTITWEPSGGKAPMEWVYEATCTGANARSFGDGGPIEDDTGELTISDETLKLGEGDTCTVEVQIVRYQFGELDPAIPEGIIIGAQLRSAHFTIGP